MNYFVLGATISYLLAGVWSLRAGNMAWAFMWWCYAAANVCLMFAEHKK